jgi:hypothetical protein
MNLKTLLIAGAVCAMAAPALAQTRDINGDGKISKAEYVAGVKPRFQKMDANKDGKITIDEMGLPKADARTTAARGKNFTPITLAHMQATSAAHFDKVDTNKDGFMSEAELRASVDSMMALARARAKK